MYWITGILGITFALAPFLFNYSENTVAMWTSVILGGAVLFASFAEGAEGNKGEWEYWIAGIAGLGAIAAPYVLGFGTVPNALWTSVGIGFVLALLAGSKLYYDQTSS